MQMTRVMITSQSDTNSDDPVPMSQEPSSGSGVKRSDFEAIRRARSPKITSAAKNSFVPSEGRFSKNYGADKQRLQISDPHF